MMLMYRIALPKYCLDRVGVFGEDDCRLGWQSSLLKVEGACLHSHGLAI